MFLFRCYIDFGQCPRLWRCRCRCVQGLAGTVVVSEVPAPVDVPIANRPVDIPIIVVVGVVPDVPLTTAACKSTPAAAAMVIVVPL